MDSAVMGSDGQPEGKELCQTEGVCPVRPLPTWPWAQTPLEELW